MSGKDYYKIAKKFYLNGDYKNARINYEKSSEMGYVKSYNNLGAMINYGVIKCEKSIEYYWEKKSAELGYKKANINLGDYYINNNRVEDGINI